MVGQIDLATDRPEKQPLLTLAQFLMAGFVCGRDELVRLRKAVFGVDVFWTGVIRLQLAM